MSDWIDVRDDLPAERQDVLVFAPHSSQVTSEGFALAHFRWTDQVNKREPFWYTANGEAIWPVQSWQSVQQPIGRPEFKHDCSSCISLGCWIDHQRKSSECLTARTYYDLYYCEQNGSPTVIARYGDNGSEYASGANSPHPALIVAQERAMARGLGFPKPGMLTMES